MRKIININNGWQFKKEDNIETVNLPHTWNSVDAQEGANYYRGKCTYTRELPETSGKTFIEINGANSVAEVYVNGQSLGEHRGGYSMFRFDISDYLGSAKNIVEIKVDNSDFEDVYPSMADFSFYGGLYRDVNLITNIAKCHFSLEHGKQGIYAIPKIEMGEGILEINAHISGDKKGVLLCYKLEDENGNLVAETECYGGECQKNLKVKDPILWDGTKNPYLYTLKAILLAKDELIDAVEIKIGFREISFDAEKGCYLNGRPIKLKGVSRHQDRYHMGNALTEKEHLEDIKLIKELGANSIRLAHYQQDEKFYNLCDEYGFLVWAEVPVISRFSEKKQANAKSQLKELITQNINHPSIFCWGIQNEITMGGKAKSLEPALKELEALAKKLDPSRHTAAAQVMMCSINSSLNDITDILGYNLYFGWYMQTTEALPKWLDRFHNENPNIKLCLSEYGAEGILKYQNEKGVQGDYSETYQAYFHEQYIRAIEDRAWLWGSYVWNMFDFGAANRDEGGVLARNNKGLVTIDRKTKKDSFYVYKAFWSDEPFVHIGGQRYVQRKIGTTRIAVYSNLKNIILEVNGKKYEQECDHVTWFEDIEIIEGENIVVASAEGESHKIIIIGTEVENKDYIMPAEAASFVKNWFVDELDKSGCFSAEDKVKDLLANEEIQSFLSNNMVGDAINKKTLDRLLALIKPFKIKTILKILPVEEGMKEAAIEFISTIKK